MGERFTQISLKEEKELIVIFSFSMLSLISVDEMRTIFQQFKINADDVEELIKECDQV